MPDWKIQITGTVGCYGRRGTRQPGIEATGATYEIAEKDEYRDFENPEVGELLKKYMKGADGVPVEKRVKMYRLAEKLAMESADTISDIHGGGSPEAHRVTIFRETNVEKKKKASQRLAGIED